MLNNAKKNNAEAKPYDVVMMFKIKPNKKRHKDIDARWTQKGGVNFFGYKLNGKVDRKSNSKSCRTRIRFHGRSHAWSDSEVCGIY